MKPVDRTVFSRVFAWLQDHEAANFDVTKTALGHIVGNKVERSYARSDLLEQRRTLMERWASFVTNPEAKLVQLPPRA